tara:strand:+ start:121 stop:231 length:111 start_codon:yes stop_codon:yes gene_type:complete
MICLINKLDSGVKDKTDEFKKIFPIFLEASSYYRSV